MTMPFLFPDAETAAEVLDSTGGEALNGVLAELGLRGLAYGELGFRYPTTSEGRAVTAPEDLEGLKIRTAGMLEVSVAYVDCWGAELYPSSFLDVMTPLSAGYYDGQESTLAEADAAGYQTVQTDVTIFPAFYEPAILTMNSDLYDSLSPDLREAVDRCGREAMADQRLRNRVQEVEIHLRFIGQFELPAPELTEEEIKRQEQLKRHRIKSRERYQKIKAGEHAVGQPFMLTCKCCGQEFASKRTNTLFCGPNCRAKFYRQEAAESRSRACTCENCGKEFITTRSDVKYCSDDCRYAAQIKRQGAWKKALREAKNEEETKTA